MEKQLKFFGWIIFNNIDELCAQLEADKKIAEKF